jgi:hypothetical protein
MNMFGTPDTEVPLSQRFSYATRETLKQTTKFIKGEAQKLGILSFDQKQQESLPTEIFRTGKEFVQGSSMAKAQEEYAKKKQEKKMMELDLGAKRK